MKNRDFITNNRDSTLKKNAVKPPLSPAIIPPYITLDTSHIKDAKYARARKKNPTPISET